MPAVKPPPFNNDLTRGDRITPNWSFWLQTVRKVLGNDPFPLASYTVATAPSATSYTGHLIYVPDETGGATVAFSDGTNWRRVQDRTIIS